MRFKDSGGGFLLLNHKKGFLFVNTAPPLPHFTQVSTLIGAQFGIRGKEQMLIQAPEFEPAG